MRSLLGVVLGMTCFVLTWPVVTSFTLATASAPELRAMVKQLMDSKRELEASLSTLQAENEQNLKTLEEHERTITLLKASKRNAVAASGGVDPQLKIVELTEELKRTKEQVNECLSAGAMGGSSQGNRGDTAKLHTEATHYMCERRVSDLMAANVYLDNLNASMQPSVVRSDLLNLPGITSSKGGEPCGVEPGDVLISGLGGVPVSPLPLQQAIEEALSGNGDQRILVPLVGVVEDEETGDRPHQPIRGRDGPGCDSNEDDCSEMTPVGFALRGFLDVTVLSSPLVMARFEAPLGTQHRSRLDQEHAQIAQAEARALAAEKAEQERRRALLSEQQKREDEERARVAAAEQEQAQAAAAARAEEEAKREAALKASEAAEHDRAYERTQWDGWRAEGRAFDYDVEVLESEAAKHKYAMGLSFEPEGPVVSTVGDNSLAMSKKIAVGDFMIKVNDVVTAGMPTPLAVRTLTLAPWPRTLYFKVPEREVAKEVEEEEAEAAAAVAEPVDEAALAAQLEAYMLDPQAAAAAEKEASLKRELAPRKKGKWKKKRPESLVLRVTEPELLRGDYSLRLASWGPLFEGPDHYYDDNDDNALNQLAWPCIPLPVVTAIPSSGCVSSTGGGGGGGAGSTLQLSHPHPAASLDPEAEPEAHVEAWGYAPEDLPMVALVVRGTCVFTDKIRALQALQLPEASLGGGGDGEGSLIAAAVVVNTDDTVLDVPAGRAKVDDLTVTVTSMNASSGDVLREALQYASLPGCSADASSSKTPTTFVKAWVGTADDCSSLLKPLSNASATSSSDNAPPPVAPLPRKAGDDGGKVLALSSYGDPLGPYDFHSALFGPSKEKAFPFHGPVRMVVADPIQACDVKAFKVRVRGLVAVVERSGCGFADKCLNAQLAGAVGCVVINTEPGTSAMMAQDNSVIEQIKIPCLMASMGLGEDIQDIVAARLRNKAADNSKLSFIARFVFEDFYGKYDVVE